MNARLQLHDAPRLGFLGVGWIGCQRMQVLVDSGAASVVAIADPHAPSRMKAAGYVPDARQCESVAQLLACDDLDGVVIATPSGVHTLQAMAALERGLAVFCQKPLTRTAGEARQVVDAARSADRLLDVDFSYRAVSGVPELRDAVRGGELGEVYAIDLVFHNAYGPGKPWFYELAQSGGGCVMDLGIHLVDLAQWVCGSPGHAGMNAALYAKGSRLTGTVDHVEDYASAQWFLDNGAQVRMTCSWRLSAGCDAVIQAAFHGTRGGAMLRNVAGSFYDFTVERFAGTVRTCLAAPPDAWGGRTLVAWAGRLRRGDRFDPAAEDLVQVARTVDAIYGR